MPFGRKASAALRSLYPVVLGLGGWFLAALIAVTTMPGVPIDDELLVVLSVGLPVGLGIYLAWVSGDRFARSVGFAAAIGGALVGAWLGFNATEGLFGIVCTLGGAIAGANLTLLTLDISWDRQVHAQLADAGAKEERLEVRPVTG